MGASFRNSGEILQLAGCDRLTISRALLKELSEAQGEVPSKLTFNGQIQSPLKPMTEAEFYWQHYADPMARDKLADGIRKFAIDQEKLEKMLAQQL
ncbi:Transaldolase B [Arsenophonus endosymbiont of Bemisia tabaci Q2]|nr:Transaldolase B [Arsenophonus endosymbiont of Bemisia tabaci Q2]